MADVTVRVDDPSEAHVQVRVRPIAAAGPYTVTVVVGGREVFALSNLTREQLDYLSWDYRDQVGGDIGAAILEGASSAGEPPACPGCRDGYGAGQDHACGLGA